jgi:hypothetical protein
MNIIDKTTFTKFLQELVALFSQMGTAIKAITVKISHAFFPHLFLPNIFKAHQKRFQIDLYLGSNGGS